MRYEKAEIECSRNWFGVRCRRGGLEVNSDNQGLAYRRRTCGSTERAMPLHPGLVIMSSTWIVAVVVMVARGM